MTTKTKRRRGHPPSRVRKRLTQEKKEMVKDRDSWCCAQCGEPENLTVDHIRPLTMGGTNDMSNLQTLCVDCNRRKGDWDETRRYW